MVTPQAPVLPQREDVGLGSVQPRRADHIGDRCATRLGKAGYEAVGSTLRVEERIFTIGLGGLWCSGTAGHCGVRKLSIVWQQRVGVRR